MSRPATSPPPATACLAAFAAGLRFEQLPLEVTEHVKLCVLDALGCAIYGAALPWTRQVAELVLAEGARPEATILGTPHRTSAALAALANGTAGHAFELDDIHRASILHAGSLALPAALAIAEARGGITGRELIAALVAGYEVGARVGMSATQGLFFRGFHPQGTTGVFAAAAAAARALGLEAERAQHALGIAGSQAAGLMAAQEGAMVKRFHSGRAAQSGVYGALLAERGFTGIPDVLEAPFGGFLGSFSDRTEPAALTAGLGETWEVLNVGFKPHAAVTSIHAALDALAAIMSEHQLAAEDIAGIEVGVGSMTHTHCAWEYRAQGVTAAQMNLHYGLAVMALEGAAFVDQYQEERLADPAVLDLVARVRATVDPEIDALGPAFRHAGRVTVRTRDGRRLLREVLHRRGSPENPLGRDGVVAKFRVLAGALETPVAGALLEQVERLEDVPDATALARMTAVG